MRTLLIELKKEKRTGIILVLLIVGLLGAGYAFVNFLFRKDTLLNLPLAPMDVLLTQLSGLSDLLYAMIIPPSQSIYQFSLITILSIYPIILN